MKYRITAVALIIMSVAVFLGSERRVRAKESSAEKRMTVIATAYSDDPISINVPEWRDGKTATMTDVRWGVVAVDPRVIPLGSKIFIEGMGWFSAEDKGSRIKGNKIDIFYPTRKEALNFGVKELQILIADNETEAPES